MDHLAICFEMSREKIAPVKPTMPEKTASIGMLSPSAARKRSTPSTLSTTESTSITAMLVARNRMIRFMS